MKKSCRSSIGYDGFCDDMSPLAEDLHNTMPWLFTELNFRIIQDTLDTLMFGNCIVVLNGPEFRLRFVKDRGYTSASLAPLTEPQNWWNLDFLVEAVQGKMPEPNLELSAVGQRLRESFPSLVEALGPKFDETFRELERRSELRAEAFRNAPRPTPIKQGILRRYIGRVYAHWLNKRRGW